MGELRGERLRCERLVDPLAVGPAAPRLSWIVVGDEWPKDQRQTAYRVLAAASSEALAAATGALARDAAAALADAAGLLWDSGRVASDDSLAVAWNGRALAPGERVLWRVVVWDADGVAGPPSDVASFTIGIDDWRGASWVGHGEPWAEHTPPSGDELDPTHAMGMSSALLRGSFRVDAPVAHATVYATARGLYRLHVNGLRVGDHELSPGWTDYRRRIHYQAFDVTEHLLAGENAIGVELGEGWYAGYLGWLLKKPGGHYGQRPSALVCLRVEHEDGSVAHVVSGPDWRATPGPREHSDLQHGERFDARLAQPGWAEPHVGDAAGAARGVRRGEGREAVDHAGWEPAVVHAPPVGVAVEPQPCEPVRVVRELAPVALHEPQPGTWIFDLGQNMVGWARLRAAGPRGTRIVMRFGEALAADGTLYTENLRTAAQRDTYVLAGEAGGRKPARGGRGVASAVSLGRAASPAAPPGETFEPAFTLHGFRYVELTGCAEPPALGDLVGRVVHTDARWAGRFACSDELLNAISSNVEWGQRGNFVSVPTDCPQRDERLGWLADTQVFTGTALRTMDCTAFLDKWLVDVRDGQAPDGAFPDIAPLLPDYEVLSHGAPGWGDAGVIVPWLVYRASGDRGVLERAYPAMERWMAHLAALNPGGLRREGLYNSYGDWLGVDGVVTDKALLATAYWALDAQLMARIASAIGSGDDEAAHWRALQARIAGAFRAEWLERHGRLRTEVATQTACLLALHSGVLDGERGRHERPRSDARRAVAEQLAADVAARGLTTGFLGTGLLCPLLTEHGHAELAYDLALSEAYPSWGFSVRQGATTMWERWDGWTPEHGFGSPNMNSFNHYAFGAIGEWLHRHVAGLDQHPDDAGWAHVVIRPHVDARLRWAHAEHDSPRGLVKTGWKRSADGDELTVTAEIPPNARATVCLPGAAPVEVGSGRHVFTAPWPAAPHDAVAALAAAGHHERKGRDGDD